MLYPLSPLAASMAFMSTPWLPAIAPTVSPGTTVYRLGSPAGAGAGAGSGAGAGAAGAGTAGAGSSGGAGAASAAGTAGAAACTATDPAPESAWPADWASVPGDGTVAASATWAAVVVPWPVEADGAASAPTPTAATTAAVAMPAHSLLLMCGRLVLSSVRGSSVAKLLLVPSGELKEDWFMGGPSGFGPATAVHCTAGDGRIEMSLRRWPRQMPEPQAAQVGGIRTPRRCGTPREGGNSRKLSGTPPLRGGPRSPESRNSAHAGHQ